MELITLYQKLRLTENVKRGLQHQNRDLKNDLNSVTIQYIAKDSELKLRDMKDWGKEKMNQIAGLFK